MGDWRRVKVEGTCDPAQVPRLHELLTLKSDYSNFHCMVYTKGICGLPNWAGETINAVGNLSERDYDQDSVADVLKEIIEKCPSLRLKVHVGGEYEADDCVATVTAAHGAVTIGPAEVAEIPKLDEAQMKRNMMAAMGR